MATATPIHHPNESARTPQFYPCSVTFKATGPTGAQEPFLTSLCAYQAAYGGQSDEFETEAATSDRLLLPTWEPNVQPQHLAVLTINGTEKRFNVIDALPVGTGPEKTLVLITPKPGA